MAKFYSTKTYGTDRGLSCCFRQWRATHSHCSTLHGYSLGIKLIFESDTLDDKNWVMDFGGLKAFKEWSEWQFDHTMVIAKDETNVTALSDVILDNITFKSYDYSKLFLYAKTKNFTLMANDKSKVELNLKSEILKCMNSPMVYKKSLLILEL